MTTVGDCVVEPPKIVVVNTGGVHWFWLLCSVGVLVTATLLVVVPPDGVRWRWASDPLPELCVTRSLFGRECPGCGLTRSIISLVNGDWRGGWNYHSLGWLVFLLLIVQIPYRIFLLMRLRHGKSTPSFGWEDWLIVGVLGLMMLRWIWRLVEQLAA